MSTFFAKLISKVRFSRMNRISYLGNFKDGLYHGQGILTLQDGTRQEGEFKEGLYVNIQN